LSNGNDTNRVYFRSTDGMLIKNEADLEMGEEALHMAELVALSNELDYVAGRATHTWLPGSGVA
jgi:hypothetical protein